VTVSTRRERVTWALAGAGLAVLVVIVGVLVVALLSGGDDDGPSTTSAERPTSTTSTTAEGGPTQPADPGTTEHSFRQGLLNREYTVIAPTKADGSKKLPVVVVLHGLGSDRRAAASTSGIADAVDRYGFIAVLPQGVANSWNAGPCCPPATLARIDDAGFLDRVVSEVQARPDADADRTYMVGFSNGGIMAYSEACARSETFTRIVVVAGVNLSGCSPTAPVSLLHIHGDADKTVPFDGSFTPAQILASADIPPVAGSVAAWAKADACSDAPKEDTVDGVQRTRWSGCGDDSNVELLVYPGLGHEWPAKPIDALDLIVQFLDLD
jgi:polyhydroxybutyrate depolymerase